MEQDRDRIRDRVAGVWGDDAADSAWAGSSEIGLSLVETTGERREPDILDFEPVELRARRDGWTRDKQCDFIEALADCGIVREAAARVGMTAQTAYRLRRRPDAAAFDRAWRTALGLGAERLRSTAYERAVTGTVKSYYYRGEKVGEDRVYDNRLLMFLIGKAEQASDRHDPREVIDNWDGWMQAIEDGLDAPAPRPDEGDKPRVWQEIDGAWWTDFPPPPGFDGEQHGEYGQQPYRRACGREERDAIRAMRARDDAEEARRRDLYFARLKDVSAPT